MPVGSFFFTVFTDRRAQFLTDIPARPVLGSLIRRCQMRWPFHINAMVLLPEHLHAIWSLPPGDTEYPKRWAWIKKEFTKTWLSLGGTDQPQTPGRKRDGSQVGPVPLAQPALRLLIYPLHASRAFRGSLIDRCASKHVMREFGSL